MEKYIIDTSSTHYLFMMWIKKHFIKNEKLYPDYIKHYCRPQDLCGYRRSLIIATLLIPVVLIMSVFRLIIALLSVIGFTLSYTIYYISRQNVDPADCDKESYLTALTRVKDWFFYTFKEPHNDLDYIYGTAVASHLIISVIVERVIANYTGMALLSQLELVDNIFADTLLYTIPKIIVGLTLLSFSLGAAVVYLGIIAIIIVGLVYLFKYLKPKMYELLKIDKLERSKPGLLSTMYKSLKEKYCLPLQYDDEAPLSAQPTSATNASVEEPHYKAFD